LIAIDTNLLVYAQRRHAVEHRAAQRAIERASADPRGWGISLPCIAEFWGVVTHPAISGGPSPAREARNHIGIEPHGDGGLLGAIESPDDRVGREFADLGNVGRINLAVRHRRQRFQFLACFSR
jgi:predicted nucleic acid-binding protein